MSSEAITRNDLTAILNEVLPPTPSEYKKLLWTNPSPTSNFPTQALLNGQDLTVYDAIEVIGVNYDGYGSIMPPLQIPIGGKGNLIGLAGSTGDSAGIGFLVMRGISANANSIVVSGAMGVSTNGSSWSANDNNMVPIKIYGIKYERVLPPAIDALEWKLAGTATAGAHVTVPSEYNELLCVATGYSTYYFTAVIPRADVTNAGVALRFGTIYNSSVNSGGYWIVSTSEAYIGSWQENSGTTNAVPQSTFKLYYR